MGTIRILRTVKMVAKGGCSNLTEESTIVHFTPNINPCNEFFSRGNRFGCQQNAYIGGLFFNRF